MSYRGMLSVGAVAALAFAGPASAQPYAMGTAFTYQGLLEVSGDPVTDTCEFKFGLWDDLSATAPGNQVGTTIVFDGVGGNPPPINVDGGLFEVDLDFGPGAIDGTARWLEMEVKCTGDPGFTALAPRTELTPAPYAQRAGTGVGGTDALNVNSAGDVGIGTTSPMSALHVEESSGGTFNRILTLSNLDTTAGNTAVLDFSSKDTGGSIMTFAAIMAEFPNHSAANQRGALHFYTRGLAGVASRMTIDPDGNVGIGVTSPAAKLQVQDGAVLFDGTTGGTPASGAGTRLMWVPAKKAFRAGYVEGDRWDNANIGEASVAIGGKNIASGFCSVALGFNNFATGGYVSTAIGQSNKATGLYSTAIGFGTEANGWGSGARGNYMRIGATGLGSYGIGLGNNVTGWTVSQSSTMAIMGGNVGIGTTSPSHPLEMGSGAHVTSGGVWTDSSDRDRKEGFDSVDVRGVLERVSALPISTWRFKVEDPSVRHMGVTAQDFHAAFGLGNDDRHIAALDTGGVTLAAIQGLYEIITEKECELETLRADNRTQIDLLRSEKEAAIAELKAQNGELEARLAALEKLMQRAGAGAQGGAR